MEQPLQPHETTDAHLCYAQSKKFIKIRTVASSAMDFVTLFVMLILISKPFWNQFPETQSSEAFSNEAIVSFSRQAFLCEAQKPSWKSVPEMQIVKAFSNEASKLRANQVPASKLCANQVPATKIVKAFSNEASKVRANQVPASKLCANRVPATKIVKAFSYEAKKPSCMSVLKTQSFKVFLCEAQKSCWKHIQMTKSHKAFPSEAQKPSWKSVRKTQTVISSICGSSKPFWKVQILETQSAKAFTRREASKSYQKEVLIAKSVNAFKPHGTSHLFHRKGQATQKPEIFIAREATDLLRKKFQASPNVKAFTVREATVCSPCNESHEMYHCRNIQVKEVKQRAEIVQFQRICYKRIASGHFSQQCSSINTRHSYCKLHQNRLHATKKKDTVNTVTISMYAVRITIRSAIEERKTLAKGQLFKCNSFSQRETTKQITLQLLSLSTIASNVKTFEINASNAQHKSISSSEDEKSQHFVTIRSIYLSQEESQRIWYQKQTANLNHSDREITFARTQYQMSTFLSRESNLSDKSNRNVLVDTSNTSSSNFSEINCRFQSKIEKKYKRVESAPFRDVITIYKVHQTSFHLTNIAKKFQSIASRILRKFLFTSFISYLRKNFKKAARACNKVMTNQNNSYLLLSEVFSMKKISITIKRKSHFEC
ncbi:uncharacterized protein LOC134829076 [Culicoides brevitarsis]|uniref:uncharacterized protein LOC134829076 n=1 Tax=Culicoides brevitarsis TaxID=469753 RepID=UPI00307B141E